LHPAVAMAVRLGKASTIQTTEAFLTSLED
jgi:hypothetical protein